MFASQQIGVRHYYLVRARSRLSMKLPAVGEHLHVFLQVLPVYCQSSLKGFDEMDGAFRIRLVPVRRSLMIVT